LRRVYLDIVGTVPPIEVTTQFLADASPDKRAKLVDRLLASPEYADHWMNYWDDVLMGKGGGGNLVDRAAFRAWLHARFAANDPWDRVASELVSATGENGEGGAKPNKKEAGLAMGMPRDEAGDSASPGPEKPINGAVNWTLRFEQNPQDLGGTASRVLLGVQIQCAQCHDHKTERWKQDDFRRFSTAFLRSKIEFVDDGKTPGMLRRARLVDSIGTPPRFTKRAELAPIVRAKATALDGTNLERGTETRRALATWITSKDNPWFAKAFVNRMWGHFLGRGFVEPVDDLRPSNAGVMPEVLDRMAADFALHGFDVQRLIRTICATEAYHLTASGSGQVDPENHLWATFHLVPLGAEELLNSVFRVTALEQAARRAKIDNIDDIRRNVAKSYQILFDVDEEEDAPQYSGTIAQALSLLNGALVGNGSRSFPGSMLSDLLSEPGSDTAKIDALTLRVLARHATAEEEKRFGAYVETAMERAGTGTGTGTGAERKPRRGLDRLGGRRAPGSPKVQAYEDILWAMLNSSEFTFNH
jgi:hypothetical protein